MSMRDLASLSRKIIHDYPDLYKIFGEREFVWEGIRQPNRNPLLGTFPGADGLKTGHTEEAGYGLAGSAKQNGVRRIVVFHGMPSDKDRSKEAERLMRIAFNDFETKTLYKSGDVVGDALVFKGVAPSVSLVTKENVSTIVHRSASAGVKATIVYEGPVKAPVAADQQIGYLRLTTPAGDAREFPLYAAKAVKEVGFFGKVALAAKTLLTPPPKPAAQTGADGGAGK